VSQFVPVVGTYIAGILPLLLTVVDSPLRAGIVVAVIVIYQQLENFVVAPRVTAHTLEIHPAIAFGAVIAGAALFGPLGAVLGLPVAAMVQGILGSVGLRYDVVDGTGNDPDQTEGS
jgi:predicted PurR-regulated permease PerM